MMKGSKKEKGAKGRKQSSLGGTGAMETPNSAQREAASMMGKSEKAVHLGPALNDAERQEFDEILELEKNSTPNKEEEDRLDEFYADSAKYDRYGKYQSFIETAHRTNEQEKWQQEQAEKAELAEEALEKRLQRREAKRQGRISHMPNFGSDKMKATAPSVWDKRSNMPTDFIYRGMSVNNISNLLSGQEVIFTVRNPKSSISEFEHVANNDPQSPFLSFEANGLSISAGKYAPKPVGADNNPSDTTQDSSGFLTQEKSYGAESQQKNAGKKYIGYVGALPARGSHARVDVSDEARARRVFGSGHSEADMSKALAMAISDREVLVKPGEGGITKEDIPFVASIQLVSREYYERHCVVQTPEKAVGYFKGPKGKKDGSSNPVPVFYKIQIQSGGEQYELRPPRELLRMDDDSEEEMSDNEDMSFSKWKLNTRNK